MKHRKTRSAPAARVSNRGLTTKVALAVAAGVLVLGGIFWANQQNRQTSPSTEKLATVQNEPDDKYVYQVGKPGPGDEAPPIRLAASTGVAFDLASLRGKFVMLYFQEGATCQPCWDQLKAIESNIQQFRGLGIEAVVSITTDPLDVVKQIVADARLSTPVLSDPDLSVSQAYDTNSYGMMGKSRNGHTFILIDRDGRILWRADYGGAPDYTMYVPFVDLMADLRNGLQKQKSKNDDAG